MKDGSYEKRLRAVVQNCLSDFSIALEERGMQRKIVDDTESIDSVKLLHRPKVRALLDAQIHYSEFVEEVRQRMRRSRGKELPGTFNPLIIGDLFYLQSRPWETITTECIGKLLKDAQRAILPIVRTVLDEESSMGLEEHVINPSLDKIEVSMRIKTDELLNPQRSGHPITYNHYFTEIIQKARNDHLQKSITKKLKRFFGDNYPSRDYVETKLTFRMDTLISTLGTETEASMERFACSEAISCMQAYYKVARKKFVDDFSILAVEKCLLELLAIIFNSRVIGGLADDVVRAIATEDEDSKLERERLISKLKTLQSCLEQLHRLDRHDISVIKGTNEDISEGPDVSSSDARTVRTENTGKTPSLISFKTEINNKGMDSSTERKIEIPEPPLNEWEISNNLQSPNKTKKRHLSAGLWE